MARKIFISHAHKDKLFIDFVNNFLIPKVLNNFPKDEVSFTSDEERERGKISGQDNLELFNEVSESELFICCISDFYNKSPFCILEHGVSYHKFIKDRNSISLFPILADGFNYKNTLITINTLQHADISNKLTLLDLFDTLKNRFSALITITKNEYEKDLNVWYSNYNNLKRKYNKLISNKEELFEKVVNSFPVNSDIEFPVTIFCNRKEYENLSIKSADKAEHLLLWTLYKSPLLVEGAYSSSTYLTKYDETFRDSKAGDRFRLVVFEDYNMAEEYFNCDSKTLASINSILGTSYSLLELQNRKSAFESSNSLSLYFTTKDKIKHWYKTEISSGIDIPDYFDYEFGFLASSKAINSYYGFTSGFHSNTAAIKKSLKKHMIFYPKTVDTEINKEFNDRMNEDYHLFYDIPIQIKLVDHLTDEHSELRKTSVIHGTINSANINLLK
jgi:hypothetical protein